MVPARNVEEGDRVGTQTWSLAWRLARGELGDQEHVFTPTQKEVREGVMDIGYDCAEDKYFSVRYVATGPACCQLQGGSEY